MFAEVVLGACESYGNLITLVVSSLKFLTPFALDVVGYMCGRMMRGEGRVKVRRKGGRIGGGTC